MSVFDKNYILCDKDVWVNIIDPQNSWKSINTENGGKKFHYEEDSLLQDESKTEISWVYFENINKNILYIFFTFEKFCVFLFYDIYSIFNVNAFRLLISKKRLKQCSQWLRHYFFRYTFILQFMINAWRWCDSLLFIVSISVTSGDISN